MNLLSDLDDTLYPYSSGLATACGNNIKGIGQLLISVIILILFDEIWILILVLIKFPDYMVEKLGIDRSKIVELSNLLYKNYGTTMAGLRVWFRT